MEIEVMIGELITDGATIIKDTMRLVSFEGEELGARADGEDAGTIERLYRDGSGKLMIYVEKWSKLPQEVTVKTLQGTTEEELDPGGRFERLGWICGTGRWATIDDAATPFD